MKLLWSTIVYLVLIVATTGQVLDNRDTCAHRVRNCDPDVDHFETKVSMKHSSSVKKLEYENTHILLEQSWPTRGPWMKGTSQKVVFVRCGCPIPTLSADWSEANIIHVPVSSVMVQMPNTLSKLYLIGQRSKVTAIESNRYISSNTPEITTDIRDGTIRRLDLAPNGVPSTRITLSFTRGLFPDASTGFKLELVHDDANNSTVKGETSCIFPATAGTPESLEDILDKAFNSIPGWVDAGNLWVLTKGEASAQPSTTLSYSLYFDSQLPPSLSLRGKASSCGGDVDFKLERDSAPANRPIYHRLHDLPGGFPDVLITEPRSLGPLADDPKIDARRFLDSDPGEETPLGRAELMKLMALILGSVETGNTLFDMIELRYMEAKALANKARHRPTVMVGKPGTWNEAARNSWMITVGSTYVGQFLRDANVEYRNSDDSVNQEICGSGCGVCPSGQTDTRCSVPMNDYLDLFRSADYWIAAGVGANCWSASCNFELTADKLLDENREIFSQFMPMQCGSVIALDQAHSGGGNPYWEAGRSRPDLVLRDLVTLMHPDLEMDQGEETTTFFRSLPSPSNMTGVPPCPRTMLPGKPEQGTVHISSTFVVNTMGLPKSETIGAPHFAVLDRFYPTNPLAEELGIDAADLEIAMTNTVEVDNDSELGVSVTARVLNCQDHSCGLELGQKLNGLEGIVQKFLDLPQISVLQDSSNPTLVLDSKGDKIPLELLTSTNNDQTATSDGGSTTIDPVNTNNSKNMNGNDDDGSSIGGGVIVGIVVVVLAVSGIALLVTYKTAYAKGAGSAVSFSTATKVNEQQDPELMT